jgi:hypothetical protein
MGYRVLLLVIFICFRLSTMVSAELPLTAAFIRDLQLWLKQGDQEIQVTKGQSVYSPKWSYDGHFIAYIDGDEQGERLYGLRTLIQLPFFIKRVNNCKNNAQIMSLII